MNRDIKYIFIHCTSGYSNIKSIENYWFNTLKWKTGGYHRIVDLDGEIHKMYDFNKVTNGVLNYNSDSIHISYIGGVEKSNVKKALDSRTNAQKESIIECILEALNWCKNNSQEVDGVFIIGHRDISPDRNLNGLVDANERIKECPSFDSIPEYWHFMGKKALEKIDNNTYRK